MSSFSDKLLQLSRSLAVNDQNYSPAEAVYDTHFLVSNLQQVLFQIDITGKWVYLNLTWRHITGYSIEETLGTYLMEYVHPKDRTKVEEYLQNLSQQEKSSSVLVNIRLLAKDNIYKWAVLQANSVHNKNSSEIKGIIGTLTEITEKVREQELVESKYRSLRNLINNHPGMIYRCRNDQNLTIEYVSTGSYELTGFTHDQLIQNSITTYTSIIHQDDRQRVLETIQYNLNDGDIMS